ncbi:MAG: hypothetical protein A2Z92_04820 [Omnitrophica WOR_2 bacterium GWA2_63_20]|nr:MAG: hypothetical protein A2Z92_04820 [Omnitrophica WOR_2 bacterium GWA2_63_20]
MVVLPTFRSCQIGERSLEQSRRNPEEAHLTEQEPRVSIALAVSPREILDDIMSRPSLQRPGAIQNYIGNHVDWLLEFSGATKKDGQVRVTLRTSYGSGRPVFPVMVSGEVNLSDYPWLKITQDGSEVRIRGTISDISMFTIDLDDIVLELKE